MTEKRVSLKVTPDRTLHVADAAMIPAAPLLEPAPLVVLGNGRQPPVVAEPVVPGASTLFGPRGACLTSAEGPLWICDTGHHRLLGWSKLPEQDQKPAEWLIGQVDFTQEGRNGKQQTGPATVNVPTGICATGSGLAVADAWNHRVLLWHQMPRGNNIPADVVVGQKDFHSGLANHGNDCPSARSMHWPYGIAFENGKLLVADTGNRRVLIWNSLPVENGQPADLVLGQRDFTTRDENAGAEPGDMSMRWPHGICQWRGNLCIADAGNNRIMIWNGFPDADGAAFSLALGQKDRSKVDHNQSLYWPRDCTLNMPYGIGAGRDWLMVADTANSRLLGWCYSGLDTAGGATALFGQHNFHEKGDNRWQPAVEDSLCWPYGIQVKGGLAIVSDSGNNRVSIFRLAV